MLFKNSFIPLSAAMVLALTSDPDSITSVMAASLFLIIGIGQRRHEQRQDIEEEKRHEDNVINIQV